LLFVVSGIFPTWWRRSIFGPSLLWFLFFDYSWLISISTDFSLTNFFLEELKPVSSFYYSTLSHHIFFFNLNGNLGTLDLGGSGTGCAFLSYKSFLLRFCYDLFIDDCLVFLFISFCWVSFDVLVVVCISLCSRDLSIIMWRYTSRLCSIVLHVCFKQCYNNGICVFKIVWSSSW
jgi:hypothetical protein